MPAVRRRTIAALAAALGLAFVASACGAAGEPASRRTDASEGQVDAGASPSSSGSPAADGASRSPRPARVPEVLDFTAPLVGGGTLAGAELAGSPVAVWFWAPW